MPRETIRQLADHSHRVLVAGAHLASGDPDLARDRTQLEKLDASLGAKTPVFRQLGDSLGRVQGGKGPALVAELLTLTTQVAQVRAAQTTLAPVEGELAPVAPCLPVGTPCNARELYDLQAALVQSGSGRLEKLQGAIERGDIADLRLFDAVVHAIGDVYLGDTVATRACPLFGAAIVPALRAGFDPRGGSADARRLQALVAIEKAGAHDVILRAFREGRPDVRAAALEAIADHLPGRPELEQPVLEALAGEKSQAVRRAAVRALAGYGSDASLDALLGMLEVEYARRAAAEALGRSTHPRVVERLLALLDQALVPPARAKAKPAPAPKGKAAPRKAATVDARETRAEWRARIALVLGALAPHTDPGIARRAIELIEEHGAVAAQAVLASGTPAQLGKVADLLQGDDEDLYESAVTAASRLGADLAFQRLSRFFEAGDTIKQPVVVGKSARIKPLVVKPVIALRRIDAILEVVQSGADPRWAALLIPLLRRDSEPIATRAALALGRIGDRTAAPPLVQALEWARSSALKSTLIEALGQLGDVTAVDPILAAFGTSSDYSVRWRTQRAVLGLADPGTVEKVRTLAIKARAHTTAGSGWGGKAWMLNNLLSELERRFPGR